MEEIQKLTKLGEDLQQGFADLKRAQEKQKTDTDALVKEQVSNIANDVATKLEAIQTKQGQIEAAMQRVAAGGEDKGQKDAAAEEKRQAFLQLVRKGNIHLMEPDRVKQLATDSLDNGGYLVPVEAMGVINGRIFETSPLRRIANVVSTSSKSVEMILDDQEAAISWVGEGDTVSATATPKVGRIEIAAKKIIAYPSITEEMAADSAFNIEQWLANKIADKMGRAENTAFVTGDGVSRPRGFTTYATAAASAGVYTYTRDQLEYVPMTSTSAVTEVGMINLQGSLKEAYQARATWGMKRSTLVNLMTLAGTNNYRFLNLSAVNAPNKEVLGPSITVLDKPVVLMDDMPAIGSNSLGVVYGDFSVGYTIVDRVGISVRVDPLTSPGIIKYYATKRTGGSVTNFEALKLGKFSVS